MEGADVVVVGGGGSGLTAALSAAEEGARVILLEKNPALGGSTALSVGSFSAAGTRAQSRRGIDDSAEQFIDDMAVANGDLEAHENAELREVLCRNSGSAFEWVRGLGLQFFGPTEEPPFRNPRMHNIVPHSGAYIRALGRAARRRGVDIRLGVEVEGLVQGPGGRVVGVRGSQPVEASRAVILATGDYSASSELKARWVSEQSAHLPPINPTATGDGFVLAMDLGAATRNTWRSMDELRLRPPSGVDLIKSLPTHPALTRGFRLAIEHMPHAMLTLFARVALTSWTAPTPKLFSAGAILVNSRGERFTDELRHPERLLADQPGNAGFIVFDQDVGTRFSTWPHPLSTFPGVAYAYLDDYRRFRRDATHRGADLDALAASIGAPPGALVRTVERYNALVAAGRDEDFSRASVGNGIRTAPFYAIGPVGAYTTLTDGGLAVTADCQVVDDSGKVIPGLYAVGSTGQGGLILKNHGLHIAWAITSGRLAAASAVRQPAR